MPGHIFFKVGLYDAALDVAQRSVAMDYADIDCCHPGFYAATRYYHEHNVDFLLYALTETGHLRDAIEVAKREDDSVFMARQFLTDRQWRAVLSVPYTKGHSDTVAFARGIAFAELGDFASAKQSLAEMPKASADSPSWFDTVGAMRLTLQATIAGREGDSAREIALLQRAGELADQGDHLTYAEFPALYFYSPHLALADAATAAGQMLVARRALRAELAMNPNSPIVAKRLAQLR
ncbi:MAG: hypothetical protein JOY69_10585 [Candidatus Eremiobacteraeota bacterium]|nr:hypothetical protein [Candidatus Eremiobacteraeota bacterium]